jgi:hypothetical protein
MISAVVTAEEDNGIGEKGSEDTTAVDVQTLLGPTILVSKFLIVYH